MFVLSIISSLNVELQAVGNGDWGLGARESGLETGDSGLGESGLGFLNVFRQLMNKACKQFT